MRCYKIQATQETWVLFLDWDDSLEKEMATQSSILAWRIHGQTIGSQRVGHDFSLSLILSLSRYKPMVQAIRVDRLNDDECTLEGPEAYTHRMDDHLKGRLLDLGGKYEHSFPQSISVINSVGRHLFCFPQCAFLATILFTLECRMR